MDEHANPTCSGCGYDLRGIESKNCPECGLPFYTFKATFHDPVGPTSTRPRETKWWLVVYWFLAIFAWLVVSAVLATMVNPGPQPASERRDGSPGEIWVIDFINISVCLGFPILIASVAATLFELAPKAAGVTLVSTILLAVGASALAATYHIGAAGLLFLDVLAAIGGVGIGVRIQSGVDDKIR